MNEKTGSKPTKRAGRIVLIAALAAFSALYFSVPEFSSAVNKSASVLSSPNVEAVADYIRSFRGESGYAAGARAMVFSFALMVFSSVVAPLPAFLITFSNAAIFGWWQGAILSWSSAMAGAALCFMIARLLGRDIVEKFAGRGVLASVEGYFKKHGSETILICRLLPFVSFDAVSYFAGLTPIKFLPFFIATGIGQTPATIVYSYVGGMLTGGTKYFVTGLLCIFALGILTSVLRNIWSERGVKRTAVGSTDE